MTTDRPTSPASSRPTDTEVRLVTGEELLTSSFPLRAYAFSRSPRVPDLDRWRGRLALQDDLDTLVLFEDGEARATATAIAMTQNVRGRVLPMGGVAGVATHPLGRRRGQATRVLTSLLATMRDRGHVVSSLVPFRESFYARLGWATFSSVRMLRFAPAPLAPLLRWELPGITTLHSPAEGGVPLRALLERVQPTLHGMSLFGTLPSEPADDARWVVIHREGETVTGALTYEVTDFTGDLAISAFFPTDTASTYGLLRWAALHIDQVSRVQMFLLPGMRAETWLPDLRPELLDRASAGDHPTPMGRVVDVAGLSGIGAGDGEVTLRLRDPVAPWNEGTFSFHGEAGTLRVEPAAAGAAVVGDISINALSALVFTGNDPDEFPFRGWGSVEPRGRDALRSLFPPADAYLHEDF